MDMSPKVSVVMAVYNGGPHVGEAVDSILAQTFHDFEFIIIDDGSTDETWDVLSQFEDPRLRVVRQENKGQSVALNHGIRLAWGEYIARIDADDKSFPMRLEKQVAFMDAHSEVGLLGSGLLRVDEVNRRQYREIRPTSDRELRRTFPKYNPIMHSSAMIRRQALERVGLYREDLAGSIDYDLWLRIARHYQVRNLPDVLIQKRVHAGQRYRGSQERTRVSLTNRLRSVRELGCPRYHYVYPVVYYLYSLLPFELRLRAKEALRGVLTSLLPERI